MNLFKNKEKKDKDKVKKDYLISKKNKSEKGKIKKSNKKNIVYIPLEFKENFIISKNNLIKTIKIDEIKEIKNILEITNYRNRYKLFIDIKENKKPNIYLQEMVRVEKGEKLDITKRKFKVEGELNSNKITEILMDFYRNDNTEIDSNYKKAVAPYNLKFKDDYFINDKYYGIVNSLEVCKDEIFFLMDIFEKIKNRVVISVDFKIINDEKILRRLKEDDAQKNNYTKYKIPEDLKVSIPRLVERLENAVNKKNGLILYSINIIQFADDEEQVKAYNEKLLNTLKYSGAKFITLNGIQKDGLNNTLLYGRENSDISLFLEKDKFLNILF